MKLSKQLLSSLAIACLSAACFSLLTDSYGGVGTAANYGRNSKVREAKSIVSGEKDENFRPFRPREMQLAGGFSPLSSSSSEVTPTMGSSRKTFPSLYEGISLERVKKGINLSNGKNKKFFLYPTSGRLDFEFGRWNRFSGGEFDRVRELRIHVSPDKFIGRGIDSVTYKVDDWGEDKNLKMEIIFRLSIKRLWKRNFLTGTYSEKIIRPLVAKTKPKTEISIKYFGSHEELMHYVDRKVAEKKRDGKYSFDDLEIAPYDIPTI